MHHTQSSRLDGRADVRGKPVKQSQARPQNVQIDKIRKAYPKDKERINRQG